MQTPLRKYDNFFNNDGSFAPASSPVPLLEYCKSSVHSKSYWYFNILLQTVLQEIRCHCIGLVQQVHHFYTAAVPSFYLLPSIQISWAVLHLARQVSEITLPYVWPRPFPIRLPAPLFVLNALHFGGPHLVQFSQVSIRNS